MAKRVGKGYLLYPVASATGSVIKGVGGAVAYPVKYVFEGAREAQRTGNYKGFFISSFGALLMLFFGLIMFRYFFPHTLTSVGYLFKFILALPLLVILMMVAAISPPPFNIIIGVIAIIIMIIGVGRVALVAMPISGVETFKGLMITLGGA
ncbi:MAG: hypothetical protein DRJ18_00365 [Candidatus Methanomethylicota archaeon]|nr:MAG: hypothetical protein DRJ18_00365 [Candidatus Verstraetearchaeota archaeon]